MVHEDTFTKAEATEAQKLAQELQEITRNSLGANMKTRLHLYAIKKEKKMEFLKK